MFTHRKMLAHLAKVIGVRALSVDYTLLPQGGVIPRAAIEGATACQWLLDQGIAAGRIAFAGDSAGGQLAITVQLRARVAAKRRQGRGSPPTDASTRPGPNIPSAWALDHLSRGRARRQLHAEAGKDQRKAR
jgi:acetyl esterase/lipase